MVTVALARRSGDDGGVVDGNGGWRRGASSAAEASSDDGDGAYEKGFAILWLFGALGMLLAAVEMIIMAAGVAVWFVGGW